MTQNTSTFISSVVTPGQVSGIAPRNLSERIWQRLTTLHGRFIFLAIVITIFAVITAGTILSSSIRANADLHTINKPSVDAAQAIIPYIENVDTQTTNYLTNINPSSTRPCIITGISQQQDQQIGTFNVHDCADRTINIDLQKINDELYLAGHNVAFTGEHTAIVQIEAGLEEYVSDINLMRREYLQVADTNNPADSHLRNAYHDAVAATNVLHQQITPLTTWAKDTEAGLPTCKLGTQTLSSQTWPGGGIEQNVGCLSAISKTNLDSAYSDTVKFVGISLGLVFGLCIYSCIFILWATWSMAAVTHRLLNIGLSFALIAALVLTGIVLSDFNTIYGYKGNFSVIQGDYGTVYNAGLLEQDSADANADEAHWLLALKFQDPNANTWYTDWQAKKSLVQTSLKNIQNSVQSAPAQLPYTMLVSDWQQVNTQGTVVTETIGNTNGTVSQQQVTNAQTVYTNIANSSFQAFMHDTSQYSDLYSQQYDTVFNQTGALMTALMTWCSAIFLLLGLVAGWGIFRRLKEF